MQVHKLPSQPAVFANRKVDRERDRDGELLAAVAATGLPAVRVADLYPGIVPCWVAGAFARLVDDEIVERVRLTSTSWTYALTEKGRAGGKAFDVAKAIRQKKQTVAKSTRMGGKRNKSVGTVVAKPMQKPLPGLEDAA